MASGFGVAVSKGSAFGSRKYTGLFFDNKPILCSEEYSGGWFASTSEFRDGKMYGKMTLYEGGNKVTNHIYEDGKVLSKHQVRHREHAFYSREGKPMQVLHEGWERKMKWDLF